jgi:acetyltransferase
MAMVACRKGDDGEQQIIGVGRLSKLHGTTEAEIAVLIGDQFQRKGLGSELTRRLLQWARGEHIELVTANILPENIEMQALSRKFGFVVKDVPEEDMVRGELVLR